MLLHIWVLIQHLIIFILSHTFLHFLTTTLIYLSHRKTYLLTNYRNHFHKNLLVTLQHIEWVSHPFLTNIRNMHQTLSPPLEVNQLNKYTEILDFCYYPLVDHALLHLTILRLFTASRSFTLYRLFLFLILLLLLFLFFFLIFPLRFIFRLREFPLRLDCFMHSIWVINFLFRRCIRHSEPRE